MAKHHITRGSANTSEPSAPSSLLLKTLALDQFKEKFHLHRKKTKPQMETWDHGPNKKMK